MGESDLSAGRLAWEGEVQQWAVTFPQALFPSLSQPRQPRKDQQSFLPSSRKHIHPGQAHPRQPHNGPYQRRSQAQRHSAHQVSHISCFHPVGQGWAQSGHILTEAKRRESTPPSPPASQSLLDSLLPAWEGSAMRRQKVEL